ncbi:glycoside hydrolase family 5 protein [Dokdonella sp. MW10]|uniref:glycoside hydrolase family 5 protein n=1 Tax=Dokdonella sp. MW10 TaxID=2992926 RepID=UPI003F81B614
MRGFHGRFALAGLLAFATGASPATATELMGVNLAGAEFGGQSFWPNASEVAYFRGKGMNVFRVPFTWERLQPALNGALDTTQLNALTTFVTQATAAGATVILDPHNYARYNGQVIGSAAVPRAAFQDFWRRLATVFRDNPRVAFGLMNEPYSMATEDWLLAANAGIAGIREAGATQLILVPGNAWTGAHSWLSNWYGTPNGTVMGGVVDPLDRYAYELHQYFDGDSSGTSATCATGAGANRLSAVTGWLRARGKRGLLGEFAGADNAACRTSIESALDYMDANRDVWLGWTWWAAGPAWGNYMYSLEPTSNYTVDRPQMAWLRPYLDRILANGFD